MLNILIFELAFISVMLLAIVILLVRNGQAENRFFRFAAGWTKKIENWMLTHEWVKKD